MSGISDHEIVSIESTLQPIRHKLKKRKIYLWKRADIDGMRREASVFSEEFLSRFTPDSNIETMWTAIKEKLLSLRESFVPSKMTSSRFHQPWVNTEVKRLSRQKNRAFKKLKTTRKSKDKDRYQSLKKKCNQACKDAYNS